MFCSFPNNLVLCEVGTEIIAAEADVSLLKCASLCIYGKRKFIMQIPYHEI